MEGGAMLNDASQIHTIAPLPKPYIRKAAKSPCNFAYRALQLPTASGRSFRIAAPINRFVPHELSHEEILQLMTISPAARNWRGRPDTTA